jgi:Sulfotransferase domain
VGPGRTGTSWLDAVLRGHVGLPARVKETEFFGKHYAKGIEWYAWHFRHCRPDLPAGEFAACFSNNVARERIARHIPQAKIICTLRDPVARSYSSYKMMRHYAFLRNGSFEDAITGKGPRFISDNDYAAHLHAWRSLFGEERVLVCFYDDLCADSQSFLDRVCDFIGIAQIPRPDAGLDARARHSFARAPRNLRLARKARRLRRWLKARRMYATINLVGRTGLWDLCFGHGEEFPPLDPEIEARLRELMSPNVEKLERMTGRDLTAWKGPRFQAMSAPRQSLLPADTRGQ